MMYYYKGNMNLMYAESGSKPMDYRFLSAFLNAETGLGIDSRVLRSMERAIICEMVELPPEEQLIPLESVAVYEGRSRSALNVLASRLDFSHGMTAGKAARYIFREN